MGDPAPGVGGLRDRVAELRASVTVMKAFGAGGGAASGAPVLIGANLALQRLLATGLRSDDVGRFVDRQLGAVLEYDARNRRWLLPTLEVYLDSGGNKLATAEALGVQRQTLYDRLARLEELLGVDLSTPVARTSLHVAVIAWRLRAGAAGYAPDLATS